MKQITITLNEIELWTLKLSLQHLIEHHNQIIKYLEKEYPDNKWAKDDIKKIKKYIKEDMNLQEKLLNDIEVLNNENKKTRTSKCD